MRVLTITPSVNARVNTRRDGQKHRTFADARNSSRCTRAPLLRRALDLRRARSLGKTRTIAIDDVPGRERGDESRKSAGDVEARAKALAELVKNSDVGNAMSVDDREKVNEGIEALEATQLSDRTCENEGIFGFYDVSYVSVGKDQVGNPAGGRFRSPLGRFLFKTIGLEQNLFAPNRIENRVAFTVLGCLPGEVTLEGTFGAVDGLNDGRTVKADFDPPGISVAGGPKLRIGPKSSVVLSTTYLDESVRLGKGSRGSLFVFTRKSAEQHARDLRRWGVGGLAIAIMLLTALGLGIFGVHQFKTTKSILYPATVVASSLISLLMAYVLRDGGIVAEDADLVQVGELTQEQKDFLTKGRSDGQSKGENVFSSQT